MDDYLARKARTLEDEFFAKKDALLIQKLRELERMERSRRALSDVSGIRDETALNHLVELGIHPDLLATLALVPLVEVAWADGRIQENERKAILEGSTRLGMSAASVDYALLEEWLKQKPPEQMLTAWVAYIRGLCEVISPAEREEIRNTFLARARGIAQAAGSLLGLTSGISSKEEAVLRKMEAAFGP